MGAAGNTTVNPLGIKNPLPTSGKAVTDSSGQLNLQGLNNLQSNVSQIAPAMSANIAQSMNPMNPGTSVLPGPAPTPPPQGIAPVTPTPPPQNPIIQQPAPPAPPPYIPPSGPSGPMSGAAFGGGNIQGSSWGPLAGYFSALMGR